MHTDIGHLEYYNRAIKTVKRSLDPFVVPPHTSFSSRVHARAQTHACDPVHT